MISAIRYCASGELPGPDEVCDARHVIVGRPFLELSKYTHRGTRVRETRRTDLNERRASQKILHRVLARPYSADAQDGHLYALTGLPDGMYTNGQEGGAADAAGTGAEHGTSGARIEKEPRHGVDEGEGVGAFGDGDLGH